MSVDGGDAAAPGGGCEELPPGWFALALASDLAVGDVRAVRAHGRDFALWRGADGVARVLPAHCPHAGADMTCGGKVHGDWLECPFHQWRWDETGALRDIPWSVKPIKARGGDGRARWPTREAGGTIEVRYDAPRPAPAPNAGPSGADRDAV